MGVHSIISKEIKDKILEGVKNNLPYIFCAHKARICEKTFYNWINRGKEDLEKDLTTEFSDFVQSIKEIESNKITEHLNSMEERSERWQARAWILERRWREHFGQDAGIIQELKETLDDIKKRLDDKESVK